MSKNKSDTREQAKSNVDTQNIINSLSRLAEQIDETIKELKKEQNVEEVRPGAFAWKKKE